MRKPRGLRALFPAHDPFRDKLAASIAGGLLVMALTVKQKKFARLVATGMKLTAANIAVYGKGKGKRKTQIENASRLAAKSEVSAAIARYERESEPIGD